MNLSFNIAKRYIFSKKSTNAINVISGISVFGIAIGTSVMILLFSVFNGLEDLLTGFFNTYNPDAKVVPFSGKTFLQDSIDIAQIESLEGVDFISKTLQEVAFFEYGSGGDQTFGIVKGVDKNFAKVNRIDSIIREGEYTLKINDKEMAVLLLLLQFTQPKRKKFQLLVNHLKRFPFFPLEFSPLTKKS